MLPARLFACNKEIPWVETIGFVGWLTTKSDQTQEGLCATAVSDDVIIIPLLQGSRKLSLIGPAFLSP